MDRKEAKGHRRRRFWTGLTLCVIGTLAVAKFTVWRLQNYTVTLPGTVGVSLKNIVSQAIREAGENIDWSNTVLIRTEQVSKDEVRVTIFERPTVAPADQKPDEPFVTADETYFHEVLPHPDMEFAAKGRSIRVVNRVAMQRLLPSRRKSLSSNANRAKALAAVFRSFLQVPDNVTVSVDDSH